ncbi:hypothetical protein BC835DRAFT_690760 [Cytidiella melzeri]|nr:hypothetical protein BC835DRAFT_690760 [Cytidiella melzeri]
MRTPVLLAIFLPGMMTDSSTSAGRPLEELSQWQTKLWTPRACEGFRHSDLCYMLHCRVRHCDSNCSWSLKFPDWSTYNDMHHFVLPPIYKCVSFPTSAWQGWKMTDVRGLLTCYWANVPYGRPATR